MEFDKISAVTVVKLLIIGLVVLRSVKKGTMKGKPMAVEYVMLSDHTNTIFKDTAILKAMIRI